MWNKLTILNPPPKVLLVSFKNAIWQGAEAKARLTSAVFVISINIQMNSTMKKIFF